MPLKENIKARKAAEELMDLGITLGKEHGLPPEYLRVYWRHVARMANQLIGEGSEQPPKDSNGGKSKNAVRGTIRLTDDDLMPFGKHKGERLGDVPDDYLRWLGKQNWIDNFPDLSDYINLIED